jgi:hypothetical protein
LLLFNRPKIVIAAFGDRGVMKIKIFGFALLLGLAAALGACEGGGGDTTAPTTPGGEPADTGATPATTPATTPGATVSPAPTSSP